MNDPFEALLRDSVRLKSPPAARLGSTVADRYVLLRLLGEGGMGAVYAARDERGGDTVAVKLMKRSRSVNEESVRRFLREGQAIAALDHPHIVRWLDGGHTDDGSVFQVMEYLDGVTLSSRLGMPLPLTRVLAWLVPILHALEACHAKGMVHRDVKPANVMLAGVDTAVERAVLLDFGVAKLAADVHGQTTRTGQIVGTLDYMAPEQANGRVRNDPRLDVWSVGAVLFECLTGRLPLDRRERRAQGVRVLRLRELRPELPPRVCSAVNAALDLDPESRTSSVASLRTALTGLDR